MCRFITIRSDLSEFMRRSYRAEAREAAYKQTKGFVHSDKIVRISNYYAWNRDTKRKELRLSNGSVGVLQHQKGLESLFLRNRMATRLGMDGRG